MNDMNEAQDIRWKQRFDNFSRAFILLRETIEENSDLSVLAPIVKEGIIKRFEYTFELAWKTLKDKMEHDGILVKPVSPKTVFKLAYQSKYIENVETWLKMANDRNLMTHTYDFAVFEKVLVDIQNDYYPILSVFYMELLEQGID